MHTSACKHTDNKLRSLPLLNNVATLHKIKYEQHVFEWIKIQHLWNRLCAPDLRAILLWPKAVNRPYWLMCRGRNAA